MQAIAQHRVEGVMKKSERFLGLYLPIRGNKIQRVLSKAITSTANEFQDNENCFSNLSGLQKIFGVY